MEHFSLNFVLSHEIIININFITISMYVSYGLENFIPFSEMIYKKYQIFTIFRVSSKIYESHLIYTRISNS